MNLLITGSTGMVGKGVLLEALEDKRVQEIVLINRQLLNFRHPKIKEIIHQDFLNLHPIKTELGGIDATLFCMGVSSVGMKEVDFHRYTFEIVKEFADTLYELNPHSTFAYVSGTGTDSSEKGKIMWARVKGKTENYILKKGFKNSYAFRPGIIIPEKGIKSRTPLYNAIYVVLWPLFSILKHLGSITTTTKFGKAMINILFTEVGDRHFENKRINELAEIK